MRVTVYPDCSVKKGVYEDGVKIRIYRGQRTLFMLTNNSFCFNATEEERKEYDFQNGESNSEKYSIFCNLYDLQKFFEHFEKKDQTSASEFLKSFKIIELSDEILNYDGMKYDDCGSDDSYGSDNDDHISESDDSYISESDDNHCSKSDDNHISESDDSYI